ncbi:phosphoglycerate mutase family protein [bacterium]|nr:phosphoglycerate mutase family protein [bacterium]
MQTSNQTTLFLLRHAESTPSSDLPERDWPLSAKGRRASQQIVKSLQPLQIERIVSSPYLRAIQTVEPFSAAVGLKVEVLADLRERKLTSGFDHNWSQVVRKAWQDLSYCLPGCESGYDCQGRIVCCLRQIATDHVGKNILVSSHGNAIGLFLNSLDSSFGYTDWAEMTMPDLFRIAVTGQSWTWDVLVI